MIETTQSSILWTYGFLRDRSVLQFYNFDQFCVQAVCISACRFLGLWMRNFYYGVFGWAFGLFRTSSWKPGQFKGPKYTIWEFVDWMRTQFSFNKLHASMVFGPVSLIARTPCHFWRLLRKKKRMWYKFKDCCWNSFFCSKQMIMEKCFPVNMCLRGNKLFSFMLQWYHYLLQTMQYIPLVLVSIAITQFTVVCSLLVWSLM